MSSARPVENTTYCFFRLAFECHPPRPLNPESPENMERPLAPILGFRCQSGPRSKVGGSLLRLSTPQQQTAAHARVTVVTCNLHGCVEAFLLSSDNAYVYPLKRHSASTALPIGFPLYLSVCRSSAGRFA